MKTLFNKTNELFQFIIVLVILSQILYLIFSIYLYVYIPEVLTVIPNGNPSPNPVAPVRIWPSGVPQSMATIGSGVAVYSILTKLGNCTPGLRVLGALGVGAAASGTYQGVKEVIKDITEARKPSRGEGLQKIKVVIVGRNKIYFALFPFINLITAPDSLTGVNKILFGVLIITVILLYCIINIVGYFGVLYIIKHSDLENKYPRLKPIIKYYQNTSIFFLIIEIVFVIITLLLVIGMCTQLLYITNYS